MWTRILAIALLIPLLTKAESQTDLQLNPPSINKQAAILNHGDSLVVELDFRMEGASIHYTLDGSDPDSTSTKYNSDIIITHACTLKARTYHPSYLPSEVITCTYITEGVSYDHIVVSPSPNAQYKADGSSTLKDGILGDSNFRKGYLGFDKGPVQIEITNKKRKRIKGIIISYIVNQGAWIFAPESISIPKEKIQISLASTIQTSEKKYLSIDLKKKKRKRIKIDISPLQSIPNWHPGKGKSGWLFIDEIIVY